MIQRHENYPILNLQEFSERTLSEEDLLFHELIGENIIEKPHTHDFFIVIFFLEGGGTHTIDFISHTIKSKQIHLIFPGQLHQWHIEKGAFGYQLMVSRIWFQTLLSSLRFSSAYYQRRPVWDLPTDVSQSLLHEFLSIQYELNARKVSLEIIQTRTKLIGLLLDKLSEESGIEFTLLAIPPLIIAFQKLVEKHFREKHTVAFYAHELHISPNYLNVMSQKHLEQPASTVIKDRLLLEAKRLLKISDRSIKDIVYELGFYDHASFTKFFKNLTAMTPSDFRR
ncbi:helix-turn-helix domain-containing protein [Sphingobacterium sp. LRF_L2]|uniref:AraC family transcriptional regulator n=1 Tax=Sphingobacterium sp. LRF_L2 TaxID=3369421 RepID=UPI003F60F2B8